MGFRVEIHDSLGVRTVDITGEATVGRASGCRITLDAAGVSPRHLILIEDGDTVRVEDSGSHDGFRHEGVRTRSAAIAAGDEVELGRARLRLHAVGVLPPPQAPTPTTQPLPGRRPEAAPASAKSTPPTETGRRPKPLAPVATTAESTASTTLSELEFGDLLYRTVRGSSTWVLSAGLHAILFGTFLSATLFEQIDRPPAYDIAATVSDGNDIEALDDTDDDAGEADDPFEEFEPTELEIQPLEIPPDRRKPVEISEVSIDEPLPITLKAVSAPTDPRIRADPNLAGAALAGASFGPDGAADAQGAAARALMSGGLGKRLLKGLRIRTTRDSVKIIQGEYDPAGRIFDGLSLGYGVITPGMLASRPILPETRALIYSCAQHKPSRAARAHLERFVRDGGYLFTTDWCLQKVIEPTFSGYIRALRDRGKPVQTDEETVDFTCDRRHPLLRGLPTGKSPSRWWLEDASTPFEILQPDAVEVLLESGELEMKYGSPLVAVVIRHGRGRIVHAISHLYQLEGNLRGAYAMQRLLVNFLHQATRDR